MTRINILEPTHGCHFPRDGLDLSQPLVFTIADVFSDDECEAFIDRIDALAPTTAPITTPHGFVMRPDIRNNRRATFDDPSLAEDIFNRIADELPNPLRLRCPAYLNERFRCYLYDPGQRFARHYDGAYLCDNGDESLLTFMIYLNDDFVGGATVFPRLGFDIMPCRGLALLFQHRLLHEGSIVHSGHKYVLRSDVMYR